MSHAVQSYFINLIMRGQRIRTRKRSAEGSTRGRRSRYALVFPRFRPRPSVSSCESGIRPGAGISFPCAATLCMSVSHMTSFIPLARASCVFKRATSSSSSAVRPSGRVGTGSASCSCSAAGSDLGRTKCSQSRRSSSRGYAVTESCVVPCHKDSARRKFSFVREKTKKRTFGACGSIVVTSCASRGRASRMRWKGTIGRTGIPPSLSPSRRTWPTRSGGFSRVVR